MAGRSFLDGVKIGRGLLAAMALAWGVLALLSVKLWSDMSWRSGPFSHPQALARQALAELDVKGGKPSAARLDRAEQLTRGELDFGPYRPAAWCRLAYIQYQRAGRVDAASAQSLRRSYEMAPFDADSFLWRVQFIFDHWNEAPMDVRKAALRETRAFYSLWDNRPKIEMMAARVRNPTGRLSLQLVLLSAPMPGPAIP